MRALVVRHSAWASTLWSEGRAERGQQCGSVVIVSLRNEAGQGEHLVELFQTQPQHEEGNAPLKLHSNLKHSCDGFRL